jgi:hypothetical protein
MSFKLNELHLWKQRQNEMPYSLRIGEQVVGSTVPVLIQASSKTRETGGLPVI